MQFLWVCGYLHLACHFSVSCSCFRHVKSLLLLFRFPLPLVSRSTLCLWNRLLLRRNPGSQSRAPSRAPWPAALNVGNTFLLNRCFLAFLIPFCLLWSIFNFLLSSPACEDVLTPAAVAESAVKVLNSCLATMPAGRTPIRVNYKDCKNTFGQQHHNNKLWHGRSMCLN